MSTIFENPFVPDSKKAKKSLLVKKLPTNKVGFKPIAKPEKLLGLIRYGDMELPPQEVSFLNDLEKNLSAWFKQNFSQNLDERLAKNMISQICRVKNYSITKLDLYAKFPWKNGTEGLCIFKFDFPKSIVNLKKIKTIKFYGLIFEDRDKIIKEIYKLKPGIIIEYQSKL